MSAVKLLKWGNSLGIRIPAADIKKIHAHAGEEFTISIHKNGSLTLTPIKHSQQGWLEAFNAIANDNELLIDHLETDFDKDEWTW